MLRRHPLPLLAQRVFATSLILPPSRLLGSASAQQCQQGQSVGDDVDDCETSGLVGVMAEQQRVIQVDLVSDTM